MDPCIKAEKIESIYKEIFGNGEPGMHDTLLLVKQDLEFIKAKEKIRQTWLIAIFCTCFALVCGMIYWGVTDHNKVRDMPEYLQANFIDKDDYNRSMALVTEVTNRVVQDQIKQEKSIEWLAKEIDRWYQNYAPLRATKGGTADSLPPTKLPNGNTAEEEYQELLKKKE